MIISVSSQHEEPWFVFAQKKETLQDGFYQCDLRDLFFTVEIIYTTNIKKGFYQKFKTINVTRGTISDGLPHHLESSTNSHVRRLSGNVEVKVEIPVRTTRSPFLVLPPNPNLPALGTTETPKTETTPQIATPGT